MCMVAGRLREIFAMALSEKMQALLEYGDFTVTKYGGKALSGVPAGGTLKTVDALVSRGLLFEKRIPGTNDWKYSSVKKRVK